MRSSASSRTGVNEIQGIAKVANEFDFDRGAYPKSHLDIRARRGRDRHHPSEKPTELLEYLIRTYTDEGDIVLDPTMLSGSTGVAAVRTGRRFIGIEKDEKYFEIAKQRIAGR
jgi:site-specific DNA-methyltransferase (adenine-specific)